MIETLILSGCFAAVLLAARGRLGLVMGVWRDARWYERLALAGALLPIPGPVDELLGLLIVRRVLARRRA